MWCRGYGAVVVVVGQFAGDTGVEVNGGYLRGVLTPPPPPPPASRRAPRVPVKRTFRAFLAPFAQFGKRKLLLTRTSAWHGVSRNQNGAG